MQKKLDINSSVFSSPRSNKFLLYKKTNLKMKTSFRRAMIFDPAAYLDWMTYCSMKPANIFIYMFKMIHWYFFTYIHA